MRKQLITKFKVQLRENCQHRPQNRLITAYYRLLVDLPDSQLIQPISVHLSGLQEGSELGNSIGYTVEMVSISKLSNSTG